LNSVLPLNAVPFITYFPVLLISTFVGGARVGAFSLVVTMAVVWWLFLPPSFSLYRAPLEVIASLAIIAISGWVIIWASEHYRRMLARLREEEHQRKVVIDELNHRIGNKLATVQAILHRELRNHPVPYKSIRGRIAALMATDAFIARSSTGTVPIAEIVRMELAPYADALVQTEIEEVSLPEKLATILALIFHELITNAVKHGALTVPAGELTIVCSKQGTTVHIEWVESGGPEVQQLSHRGMGTSLLENGLKPYDGEIELRFGPSGFSCSIKFKLPDPIHYLPLSEVRFGVEVRKAAGFDR
jgi:two-component sensor histidine kinase